MEARVDTFISLIEDVYRFILLNQWLIEQAPLQTYISALLFTPANSIIRRIFAKEEPGWVLTKPVVEQVWSRCLQAFEGHSGSAQSVAFSPDGNQIVSGSSDRTIRIWDAKSGKAIQKLEGHSDYVLSAAFSLDGSQITNLEAPSSGTRPRWGLSDDGSWVTWRGRGSIWLPPDFRPGVSEVSRDGSAIAIGCPTGRVSGFRDVYGRLIPLGILKNMSIFLSLAFSSGACTDSSPILFFPNLIPEGSGRTRSSGIWDLDLG
ncbi:hypothetical protein B0T25DRAFT_290788 [Lasiosphaeria hispida]|uniref:Mitochondrial division protein 1 n=1 Tax=Lasiosphaeria hispida TaxID=260671 RepID=A0AAJ0HC75_9PEZI|nr:hypothetical protein B0T25DRAFT_290788 [Lasiosphaeria hispida]